MQRVISLDIGSYSIKALEFVNTLKSYEVVNFHEKIIPIVDNVTSATLAPAAVEELFAEHNLRADRILTAMPGQFISSRIIQLGFSDPKKIHAAVLAEVEDAVPFSLDDMIVDHQILASVAGKTHTLAVMTKKEFLRNFLNLVQRVDIDPKSIDVDSLAFYNLCNFIHEESDDCVAMVDVGHEKTSICIVKNGLLRLFRSINIGGRYVSEFLSRDLEISYAEAQELKHKVSQVKCLDDSASSFDSKTRNVIDRLTFGVNAVVKELGRTMYAFKSFEKVPIKRIYLSGGSSKIKNFDKLLSEQLEVEVVHFKDYAGAIEHVGSLEPQYDIMAQSLAIGMRSIGTAKKQSRINLRQGEFAYVQDYQTIFSIAKNFGRAAAVIFLLLIASYAVKSWIYSGYIEKARAQYATLYKSILNTDLPKSPTFEGSVQKVEAQVKTKITQMKSAMNVLAQGSSASGALLLLKELSEKVPKTVAVDVTVFDYKNIDQESAKISISAETEGYDKQSEFIEAVKTVGSLTEITEKSSGQKPGTDGKIISFSIQATFNRSKATF